ncbi:MAG: hypothetical protein LC659_14175, partial [Myxococcales bacterium]|nr:hypothetical protein [Myxococcales bacterium]
MKRFIVLAALVASACNNKPTGFGFDVEARTNMLTAAVRNSIVSARLLVTGAESFQKDIPGVAKAAQSGAFKFRYVPGVRSGTLTIRVDGLDGSGATVAGGTAPPVNIADGKAVDAVLTLAVNGNGVTCMAGSDCMSGNCADGVCCDAPCNGVCEQCNVPGAVGVCTAAMMGTDPHMDCAAKAPAVGSNDDGGTSDDGGAGMSPPVATMCAGSCSGMRTCNFPGPTTSCGANFCGDKTTSDTLACDGNGSCVATPTMCVDFVCDDANGKCKTMCNTDAECQSGEFCNLNINKCVLKHDLGTACTGADQCKSGSCSTGVCCNTDCSGTGQTCNSPGSVGKCQCSGVSCDPGVACQLFYKDFDTDTYGDANGTVANGTAKYGCASGTNSTLAGFVADHSDCNDNDIHQHPNQTAYFYGPSSRGDYDYNCDGDPN